MAWHRPPIVCNDNAVLSSGKFEERRIFDAASSGSLYVKDVDSGFPRLETVNQIGINVFIRQETDSHLRLNSIS